MSMAKSLGSTAGPTEEMCMCPRVSLSLLDRSQALGRTAANELGKSLEFTLVLKR
jgi:hypothetical protein